MKFKRQNFSCNRIVDVVSDALILQRNVCDGKAIPHIIIDTEKFPEVSKSIEFHNKVDEGKINFTWGMTLNRKDVLLLVDSISPVELSYIVKFDLQKQFAVIDKILSAQMLYIQPGKQGDRLGNDLCVPKILVEVPNTGFEVEWKKIYRKLQIERFKKLGVNRRDINSVIECFNNEWENVTNAHLK